jgi:hypothetical protein
MIIQKSIRKKIFNFGLLLFLSIINTSSLSWAGPYDPDPIPTSPPPPNGGCGGGLPIYCDPVPTCPAGMTPTGYCDIPSCGCVAYVTGGTPGTCNQ